MKLTEWKTNLEFKGLKVNIRKTKIMVSIMTLGNTHVVFVEKVLAVIPSTVLDPCIGFTRNVVALLAG